MLLLMLGCEAVSDPVLDCLTEYSADAGYGWESDADLGVSAEDAEEDCVAEGGSGCEAADFVTRDAAFCLASLEKLQEGVEDWSAGLTYHHQHEVVVWSVVSVEVSESGYLAGETLTFDATTGETLGRSGWEATP
jgi:hypothetical protein